MSPMVNQSLSKAEYLCFWYVQGNKRQQRWLWCKKICGFNLSQPSFKDSFYSWPSPFKLPTAILIVLSIGADLPYTVTNTLFSLIQLLLELYICSKFRNNPCMLLTDCAYRYSKIVHLPSGWSWCQSLL